MCSLGTLLTVLCGNLRVGHGCTRIFMYLYLEVEAAYEIVPMFLKVCATV